ncbi:MAG: hypothetical protein U0168_06575 [Nannocystaceae bacterium]
MTLPSSPTKTLPGLKSQWTRPAACAAASRDRPGLQQCERLHQRQAAREALRQGRAGDVLHHDVEVVTAAADVKHAHDAVVFDLGQGLGLALQRGLVRGAATAHDLDRDVALQHRIEAAVDHAETARAQALAQDIAAQGCVGAARAARETLDPRRRAVVAASARSEERGDPAAVAHHGCCRAQLGHAHPSPPGGARVGCKRRATAGTAAGLDRIAP